MTTPTLNDWLGNFANGFLGQRPILVDGVKIGYWKQSNNLCGGNAYISNEFLAPGGGAIYPPSRWVTKDDLWRDITVSAYCLSKGKVPTWAVSSGGKITIPAANRLAPAITYTPQQNGSFKVDGGGAQKNATSGDIPKIPMGALLLGGGVVLILALRR